MASCWFGAVDGLVDIPDCNRMVGDLAAGQGYGTGENFVAVRTEEVEYGISTSTATRTGYLK